MNEHPITLLIADDHPLFRRGLRDVIEQEEGLAVVAEAGTGDDALEAIERLRPDIAVLDYRMPGMNGLDLARALAERGSPVAVIMLTMVDEGEMFRKAIELGVMGYILKESAVQEIIRGIRAVSKGEPYYSPALASRALRDTSRLQGSDTGSDSFGLLTRMELKVLALIAEYKSTPEIAEALSISPRTAENHRSHICSKLAISGRYALMRYALAHKREFESEAVRRRTDSRS